MLELAWMPHSTFFWGEIFWLSSSDEWLLCKSVAQNKIKIYVKWAPKEFFGPNVFWRSVRNVLFQFSREKKNVAWPLWAVEIMSRIYQTCVHWATAIDPFLLISGILREAFIFERSARLFFPFFVRGACERSWKRRFVIIAFSQLQIVIIFIVILFEFYDEIWYFDTQAHAHCFGGRLVSQFQRRKCKNLDDIFGTEKRNTAWTMQILKILYSMRSTMILSNFIFRIHSYVCSFSTHPENFMSNVDMNVAFLLIACKIKCIQCEKRWYLMYTNLRNDLWNS